MKFSLPLFLLCSALFGYGLYVGRKVERERIADEAESISQAFHRIAEAGRKVQAALDKSREPRPEAHRADTVANEPLRFKRGDADRALRNGDIAILKDLGGADN